MKSEEQIRNTLRVMHAALADCESAEANDSVPIIRAHIAALEWAVDNPSFWSQIFEALVDGYVAIKTSDTDEQAEAERQRHSEFVDNMIELRKRRN